MDLNRKAYLLFYIGIKSVCSDLNSIYTNGHMAIYQIKILATLFDYYPNPAGVNQNIKAGLLTQTSHVCNAFPDKLSSDFCVAIYTSLITRSGDLPAAGTVAGLQHSLFIHNSTKLFKEYNSFQVRKFY